MPDKNIVIALAGNPNAGKTTIFNNLTGARQHVGNYPGVTVERKEGRLFHNGYDIKVIDLPGTYSLTAYSPDERVARDVIITEKPDVVVNVLDATNLERHLYLTAQLKEMEVPLIIAVNMADMAESQGININYQQMSRLLGVPVVRVVGVKNEGTMDLLDMIVRVAGEPYDQVPKPIRYSLPIEEEVARLESWLSPGNGAAEQQMAAAGSASSFDTQGCSLRWLAIKMLESDRDILHKVSTWPAGPHILPQAEESRQTLLDKIGIDADIALVEGRYAAIRGIYHEVVSISPLDQITLTERIDKILLDRWLGLPIFFGVMWLLFQLTFTLGGPPMEWIDAGINGLGSVVGAQLGEGLLKSLLVDGIIGGVGGVLVFLPNILLLFLGIAFLEATGYMARAAFVMDEIMHRVGLHGKSFVPMLIGFGCNIPAIMATRTLENPKDRLVTILVAPLMSCGARLPVYTLLIAAFFSPQTAGNVLFSVYLIGILLALLMAWVFRKWLLRGESEPFIMELPVYRLPRINSLLIQMWERAWLYLKKAGTIILAISILMWGAFTFPVGEDLSAAEQMKQSYAGQMGQTIEPLIEPIGFDWRVGVALVAGFAAKEVVVSTMGTLYSLGEESLAEEDDSAVKSFAERTREQSGFTPLTAYVLMLFTLIYTPCMATIAVIKRETNSWKWPLFVVIYTLVLAWSVSFLVYQGGRLLGIGI